MENQINAGDQNTQQIGQNPTNQTDPSASQKRIKFGFSFRFFNYLNIVEKIGYVTAYIAGLVLAVFFIISSINSLRSGGTFFGIVDLLFLSIVLIPLLIANRIRERGLRRISQLGIATQDREEMVEAENLRKTLHATIREFAKYGLFGAILSFILLGLLFPRIFPIYKSKIHSLFGTYKDVPPIDEFVLPEKPCDPPRDIKVIRTEPEQFHEMEADGSIKILFNENIDEATLTEENVKICTKLRGIGAELEDLPCIDVANKGIEPNLQYVKEARELIVNLPLGKEWGLSDTLYTRYVDLTLSKGIKSICGLNLRNEYHVAIPIKSQGGQFLDSSENFPPTPITTQEPRKYDNLVVENLSVTKEGTQFVARGAVRNKSTQAFQPVYVYWIFENINKSPLTAKHLVNKLGGGLVNPGREIAFEMRVPIPESYISYTIEAYVE